MWKQNWPMFVCTLAIMGTLVACSWWIKTAIDENAAWVLVDLEKISR